jgi:NADH-quinone oxidoreductase subunit N
VNFTPGPLQVIPQAADYIRILPEIVLTLFGMILMIMDALADNRTNSPGNQRVLGIVALLGSLAAMVATWYQAQYPGLGFWNMVQVSEFSVFFHFVTVGIAAVVVLTSFEYMAVQHIRAAEYYALILFGAVGMCLMSSAMELVLVFIALEISSISTYILAGFRRRASISSESSLK